MPDTPAAGNSPLPPDGATFVQKTPPLLPGPQVIGRAMGQFAPPERPEEIGKLGRYRVLKELGKGGMGAVFLGFDAGLERKIALKILLPEYAADSTARERFLYEARSAAKVNSDHVVTIFDVGVEQGVPFMAMEYLQGSPLDEYLKKKGDVGVDHAVRIGRETAIGLAAAHEMGLIHRDIKPANLWLESPRGRVKILDFGLARQEKDDVHLTKSGTVMGTPTYMSPEQARCERLDARSDLFSLGGVLYRLTTGQLPFKGESTMAVLTSLAVEEPTPVRQLNPRVSESFAAVIHKLLQKKPENRYQNAREVLVALSQLGKATTNDPTPGVAPPKVEPMVVTAQVENVWSGIDDSGEVTEMVTRASLPPKAKSPPKGFPLVWVAVGCGVLAVLVLILTLGRGTPKGTSVPGEDENAEALAKKDTKAKVVTKPKEPSVKVADRKVAEWALGLGGTVWLDGTPGDLTALGQLPRGPFRVSRFYLKPRTEVSEADLAPCKDCPSLTVASLNFCPVTDADLAVLAECRTLSEIHVSASLVTDAGLAPLRDRDRLETLGLSETRVGDAGLAIVGTCRNLQKLWLGSLPLTAAGLKHLKSLDRLQLLFLNETGCGDAGAAELAGLRDLRFLHLEGCKLTDAALPRLEKLRRLELLKLHRNAVTAAGIAKLAEALPYCRIEWDGGAAEPKTPLLADWILPCDGWVSLLPLTDPKIDYHSGEGTWTRLGDEFEAVNGPRLRLPVEVAGDYDLEIRATLLEGQGFSVDLPAGAEGVGFHFRENVPCGLNHIDGKGQRENGTDRPGPTQNDRPYRLSLAVRTAGDTSTIEARIDDQPRMTWTGKTSRLSCRSGCFVKGRVDLALFPGSKVRFHDVKFRAIEGSGRLSRQEDYRLLAAQTPPDTDPQRRLAEYVLARGGTLNINGSPTAIDKAVGLPSGKFKVTGCFLQNLPWVTDADAERFTAFRELGSIWLSSTKVTDRAMAAIGGLPLKRLDVYNTGVSDVGLERVGGKNYTYLNLGNLKITDAGLKHLAGCTDLTLLSLNGSSAVTDIGIEVFKNSPRIGYLDLASTGLTDRGLTYFKDCTKLNVLLLNFTSVTDTGLDALAKCVELDRLDLQQTSITDAGLKRLETKTKLRFLNLKKTGVTPDGVERLSKALPGCRIDWDGGVIEPKKQ